MERLKPSAFIQQYFYPADSATKGAVEALRLELGLQDRDTSREAVSGYLVACRGLLWRQDTFFGFAHDKNAYGRGHATYKRMREALVALGHIVLVRKGYKDSQTSENSVSTYRVIRFPDACREPLRFEHRRPPQLLTVRERKGKFRATTDEEDDGKILSNKECQQRFGQGFEDAKQRLEVLSSFLENHPLEMNGVAYKSFSRKFNNGRLDRGGRIYTGYTSLKKEMVDPDTGEVFYPRQSATIDGEKVALIDIGASFLCVAAGLAGVVIPNDQDPYSRLSFVVDEASRKWAKRLVSVMIANNGKRTNYSAEMKEEFATTIGKKPLSFFTEAVYQAFPFLRSGLDGLEVMFRESEFVLQTLERCMAEGIAVWPLHDAIFVQHSYLDRAKVILTEEVDKSLGFKPRLSIDYL